MQDFYMITPDYSLSRVSIARSLLTNYDKYIVIDDIADI